MLMQSIGFDVELSVRRSRVRRRVLLALASLGEAYAADLARVAGVEKSSVGWVMFGYPPRYRVELALVRLGLVRVLVLPAGRGFVLTDTGRAKARELAVGRRASLE